VRRSQPLALTSLLALRGPDAVPSEDYSRWPPCAAGFFVKGDRPRAHSNKKKIMKTNTNSDSRLQNRIAQQSKQLPKIDFRRRFQNRGLSTDRVLDMLYHETPRFWELCQVVGRWVWIQFEQKQPRTVTMELAELGFHWNNRRQAWQHPCGEFRTGSWIDPRQKYPTFYPAD
jgi:hypothetical protein